VLCRAYFEVQRMQLQLKVVQLLLNNKKQKQWIEKILLDDLFECTTLFRNFHHLDVDYVERRVKRKMYLHLSCCDFVLWNEIAKQNL